jgi:hypothetical protein
MGAFFATWSAQHPILALLAGIGVGAILVAIVTFTALSFFGKKRQLERHEYELRRGISAFKEIRDALRAHDTQLENLSRTMQSQQRSLAGLSSVQVATVGIAAARAQGIEPKKPRRGRSKKVPLNQWDIVAKDDEDAGPQG